MQGAGRDAGRGFRISLEIGHDRIYEPYGLIADWLIPVAAAIERVDQCVAFAGCSSSVFTITRSRSSSLIVRGLPGRGSSCSPSKPRRANRPRHLPTVEWLQPSSAAISTLERPSAAANTNPTAKRERLRALRPPSPPLQRFALLVAEHDPRTNRHRPQSSSLTMTAFGAKQRVPAN